MSRRQRVFELGQFHLQPRFDGLRTGGEDVENHLAAVEHLDAERLLEIAGLCRREIVIEDHHVGIVALDEFGEILEFAGADIRGELNLLPFLGEFGDHARAGGGGQSSDFVARVVGEPRPIRAARC